MPLHNKNLSTTNTNIYVCDDAAGIEEANIALDEGRLAGIEAAISLGYIEPRKSSLQKDTIINRLKDLRGGPYGEKRQTAKDTIIREYNNLFKYENSIG